MKHPAARPAAAASGRSVRRAVIGGPRGRNGPITAGVYGVGGRECKTEKRGKGRTMRRRRILIGADVVLIAAAIGAYMWSASWDIPDDPDELILFSVDGRVLEELPENRPAPNGRDLLYECPVFGKVQITDPELRRQVIAAVKTDIRVGRPFQMKCFEPRHVLRVVKDGRTVDVLICFECRIYGLYLDGSARARSGGPLPANPNHS